LPGAPPCAPPDACPDSGPGADPGTHSRSDLRWIAIEDAGLLRDGLGVALPAGVPGAFLTPVPDAIPTLVRRYARTHGPFTAADAASWLGRPEAAVGPVLRVLAESGSLTHGRLRPGVPGVESSDWCDTEVLRRLRRRSLAAQRAEAEPVAATTYARFLAEWQGVDGTHEPGGPTLSGLDGLLRAVEQLAGAPLPASAIESLVLPARLADYSPALLDQALSTDSVRWQGAGTIPGNDGWITLHLIESADQTLRPPAPIQITPAHAALLAELGRGGSWSFRALADAVVAAWTHDDGPRPPDSELVAAIWDLVWAGMVTNDSFAPIRTLLAPGRSSHRRTPRGRLGGRVSSGSRPRLGSLAGMPRGALPTRTGPPTVAGRWSAIGPVETDPTTRALAASEVLLDRHGVVTRGAVVAEGVEGGFSAVYRVLARAEEAGRVMRGYFIEGLGASQFATAGAVDRLRATDTRPDDAGTPSAVVLAATDPANPYGAALDWPRAVGRRPARSAGGVVVIVDGAVALHVERGGRTALTFAEEDEVLERAAGALAEAIRAGCVDRLEIERVNGEPALTASDPLIRHLAAAGFVPTPRGYRMRHTIEY
ncbi:MAG TPA: crosslink repair DNA glycosylase YcaQ family protein, partial [Actinomycetaceae bacterium]|nr:crosslink repair DNA glycosylase YcaQ family protein [Actinomycetaceae bacterium]